MKMPAAREKTHSEKIVVETKIDGQAGEREKVRGRIEVED
jgi:hypothetical protein